MIDQQKRVSKHRQQLDLSFLNFVLVSVINNNNNSLIKFTQISSGISCISPIKSFNSVAVVG